MKYEHQGPAESVAQGPTQPVSDRRAWRAPVVTRLSVERTLFTQGSPVDGNTSGSGGG
jgi:hypothetical protein